MEINEQGGGRKVAVVGVGYWGKNLARNFAELGVLGAAVDANLAAAEQVSAQTGAPIRTLAEVLADDSVEGLAIATRAETHYDIAKAALAAGKHVFLEKPLVLDEAEADALIEQAAVAGRVLMVGHLLRYHPVFRRMLDIVHSGDLGDLRFVYSDRMSLGKIRTEEDVLWSFAPHDLSMVLALAGAEPVDVQAQGCAFTSPAIADFATMQLAFANGLRADIRASWMNYKKVQQIVAICDRGTVVFEDSQPEWSRKLSVHGHAIEVVDGVPTPVRGEASFVEVPHAEPLKLECQHFVDCMAGQASPLTDGDEGRAVLRALQRATESMKKFNQRDRDV